MLRADRVVTGSVGDDIELLAIRGICGIAIECLQRGSFTARSIRNIQATMTGLAHDHVRTIGNIPCRAIRYRVEVSLAVGPRYQQEGYRKQNRCPFFHFEPPGDEGRAYITDPNGKQTRVSGKLARVSSASSQCWELGRRAPRGGSPRGALARPH